MKKFLVMAVVALMSVTASAQAYLGGSLSFADRDYDGEKTDVFTIAPEIGYNLNDAWAIGASLNYTWTKDIANEFSIKPYARYTYFKADLVSLFVDGGFNLGIYSPKEGDSSTTWGVGFEPGVALNFTEKFSLVAHIGFLGYRDMKTYKEIGVDIHNNLSFGFYYNF